MWSPPAAVPPETNAPNGQFGFGFDRLGVRVPAVLVSAHIEPGSVVTTPLSHASMIRTLSEKWRLGNLTERDRNAASLARAFNRRDPRLREEWPVITPRPVPAYAPDASNPEHPLNQGVICAKGSSGIMKQYSPARLTQPLLRKADAPRGSAQFEPVSWDVAFDMLEKRLAHLRATDPKRSFGNTSRSAASPAAAPPR